jgi:hypothetical protein
MSPGKLRQDTNPASISKDISHFTTSDEVKNSMLPFSSPTANIRLSERSAPPTLEIQCTTNSSGASVCANATAVAASESFKSATAVHLLRFPSRGCHILTCFHGLALADPAIFHVRVKTARPSYLEMPSRRPSRLPTKPHPKLSERVTCLPREVLILCKLASSWIFQE